LTEFTDVDAALEELKFLVEETKQKHIVLQKNIWPYSFFIHPLTRMKNWKVFTVVAVLSPKNGLQNSLNL